MVLKALVVGDHFFPHFTTFISLVLKMLQIQQKIIVEVIENDEYM